MDLSTQVLNISEDQFNALFENGGQLVPPKDDVNIVKKEEKPINVGKDSLSLPTIDLDTLEDTSKEEEIKEEEKVETKEEEKKEVKDDAKTEEKTDEPSEEEVQKVQQINSILKTSVDYLIDKGLFKDFEDRDKLEINEEVYADLLTKQVEAKIDDMFGELLDSTGDYGKAIIQHIKQGGDPDEIIDLFKEQKQLENVDLSDKRNQLSIVEKYYSEVIGWGKSKIDKYISNLEATEDGLKDEASEVHSKFDEIYTKQLDHIKTQQKAEVEKKKQEQQQFINTLSSTIDNFDGFTEKDKKLVKNGVLKFNKKLNDGTPVNDFYLKFYEIQKDPKQYVELIHYVLDKEGYKQKIQVASNNKAVEKTWNFVKGNAAVSKKGAAESSNPTNKKSTLDFSGILKNK